MADVCDLAEKEIDAAIALQIATARRSTTPATPVTECVECGDPVLPGSKVCSKECCEDFDKRERMKRITGRT